MCDNFNTNQYDKSRSNETKSEADVTAKSRVSAFLSASYSIGEIVLRKTIEGGSKIEFPTVHKDHGKSSSRNLGRKHANDEY